MAKCDMSLEREDIDEEPIAGGMTFHQIGLILTALFAAIATAISFFLMFKHSTNYSKPAEQRHIIRILFMIPIYGVVSFLEYYFYHESVYYEVLRDCYEAFAIASFFALLCSYIAPDIHGQKNYFRGLSPKNWVWPMTWAQKCTGGKDKGWLRRPQSGLTWFNVIWVGVFHYCFIRVFFTIVSVTAEAAGVYCESSLSPAFASVWAQLFNAVAVSIAMYCLIQFYVQLKQDLAEHKPFLKVLSIKLVIFFVFWQSLVIDFLSSNGPLKPSKTLAYADVKVGISCVLVAIEMTFFSILHLFSFPYKPYAGKPSQGGKFGFKAIMNAFNPWDIIKAIGRGFRWLFVGRRHRHKDVSYRQSTVGASHEMHDNKFNDADNASLESQSDHMGPGYQGVDQTSPPRHNGRRYDEDGRAGLLDYAAPHPADSYPESSYLSQSAESTAGPLSYGNPGHNMPYSTQYGGFHGSGAHPSAPYAEDAPGGPQVDPRYYAAAGTDRPGQPTTAGGNWDMFGGVLGQGQGQGQSQGRPGGGPPGHGF